MSKDQEGVLAFPLSRCQKEHNPFDEQWPSCPETKAVSSGGGEGEFNPAKSLEYVICTLPALKQVSLSIYNEALSPPLVSGTVHTGQSSICLATSSVPV